MSAQGKVSVVDSTVRLEWEITKEEFDICEFEHFIWSPMYNVPMGDKQSEWYIKIYPKGDREENKDAVYTSLLLAGENESYKVRFQIDVKTPTGYWPTYFVKALYAKNGDGVDMETYTFDKNMSNIWGSVISSTKNFSEMFVQNQITLVATMAIYIQGKSYLKHRDMEEAFVKDIRSMSDHETFYDLTVICGGKRFMSNKALLASRSLVFMRMLETNMTEKIKNEINIEDSPPEIIKALLDYLSDGLLPEDFDTKAVEMIHVAEKYKLEALID